MTDETETTRSPDAAPEIVWPEDGAPVTGPDGRRWQLLTHSIRRGRDGWSETDDWHLHEVAGAHDLPLDDGRYLGETDAGRWPQHARRRAERVAAYLITHPEAEHRVLREIRAAALGEDADR